MIVNEVGRGEPRNLESEDAIEAAQNLVGDGDLDPQNGFIEIDRSEPKNPVVRFRVDRLPEFGNDPAEEQEAGDDDGDEDESCVTEVNGADGALAVIGGKGIVVTTDGKTIRITADSSKTSEDDDPNAEPPDPCAHPGDKDEGGGVDPSGDMGSVHGDVGIDGDGGVGADGEAHPGDDNCNC